MAGVPDQNLFIALEISVKKFMLVVCVYDCVPGRSDWLGMVE